ncbi:dihydroorotate dehydrogenase [Brevibacillus invocatus]|uniref:Dihydroorotate dehydrogenase n=1 Tax=Brevibacillus invocatus TaxID=173959 RepID=A0A3M8CHV6_9BACL|nr:amidohydrolase family protein [Brevibacillus invocatus]RNB75334.1 dihydroorotate dehydrogenase [Brevibacillus invocatus]
MHEQEMVIRGGSVVTALGLVETDLWVENGKIQRWGRDTLKKKGNAKMPIEIDATGMYLLPGFVTLAPGSGLQRITGVHYLQAMRKMVQSGCTSFVDILAPEAWMNRSQVNYLQSSHYNSLIDYVWHIGLETSRFTPSEVLEWCRQGYTAFHLTVRDKGDISTIDWETISQVLTSYRAMIHLHLPKKGLNGKNEREEFRNRWLETTRYWKIRTVVEHHLPISGSDEVDLFYHLFLLGGDQTERGLRTLYQHWYGNYPIAASIQDIHVDNRRPWCKGEEMLSLLVRLASRNVAKAVGLYPRKGTLAPGADADILFLKKDIWLTKHDLSTILKFSEIDLPTSVMSNGKWIYRDMTFIPSVGMGRCLCGTKPYSYVI